VSAMRFRRHSAKRVFGISADVLGSTSVRCSYEARARRDLGITVRAIDLGQYAGRTSGACFWLSLAAGLAHARWEPPPPLQALPEWAEASLLLIQVRATPIDELDVASATCTVRGAPVGLLAALLRRYMCEGPQAVMLRADVFNKLFPAFAVLSDGGENQMLCSYKAWVQKLATREFADELVVLATAHELQVQITCVPHTPETSAQPWALSTYDPVVAVGTEVPRVLLGNNDVHFMYLHCSL